MQNSGMKKVFDLGFRMTKEGYPWKKAPPGTWVAVSP